MKRLFTPGAALIIGLAYVAVAALCAKEKGLIGASAGTLGSLFNLWILWRAIGWLGRAAELEQPSRLGAFAMTALFLLKLPVFVGLGLAMNKLGHPAPAWFFGGLGLVYSAVFGWALARGDARF